MSSLVLGIEADWQWSGQKDTANTGCSSGSTPSFFMLGGSLFGQCLADEQKLTNFGSARARAGVLVDDSLWYVAGGAAWATVKESWLQPVRSSRAARRNPAHRRGLLAHQRRMDGGRRRRDQARRQRMVGEA